MQITMQDAELFKAFQTVVYLSTGMSIWDYILASPFDYQYLFGSKKWTPAFTIYFISRHFAMWNIIVCQTMMHCTAPVISCRALTVMIVVTGSIAVAASTLIFVARACAMWMWRKTIYIPLLILTLCSLAFSITTILWVETTYTPGIGCVLSDVDVGFAISNVVSLSIDVLTLVALIVGIMTQQDGALRRGSISRALLKDGVLFVAVLLVINVTSITLTLTQEKPIAQFLLAVPMFTLSPLFAGRCHRGLVEGRAEILSSDVNQALSKSGLTGANPQQIHIHMEQVTTVS